MQPPITKAIYAATLDTLGDTLRLAATLTVATTIQNA